MKLGLAYQCWILSVSEAAYRYTRLLPSGKGERFTTCAVAEREAERASAAMAMLVGLEGGSWDVSRCATVARSEHSRYASGQVSVYDAVLAMTSLLSQKRGLIEALGKNSDSSPPCRSLPPPLEPPRALRSMRIVRSRCQTSDWICWINCRSITFVYSIASSGSAPASASGSLVNISSSSSTSSPHLLVFASSRLLVTPSSL